MDMIPRQNVILVYVDVLYGQIPAPVILLHHLNTLDSYTVVSGAEIGQRGSVLQIRAVHVKHESLCILSVFFRQSIQARTKRGVIRMLC